jgi:hypothetical protein
VLQRALEGKLVEMEASTVESSAVSEKRFEDFSKITGDLAPICEAYEQNINSLDGMCSSIHSETPMAKD